MSDYQKYLQQIHSRMATPEEIVNQVVFEAVGIHVKNRVRVVAGEANEVYDVELSNGDHVFVRISRSEDLVFERENWAIDRCKEVGLSVPEVIVVKYVEVGGQSLQICLQQKLNGSPLERGDLDMHSLPKTELQDLMGQAGEVLSRIHSINTYGFGEIDGSGKGDVKSFKELMAEHIGQESIYLPIAEKAGFDLDKMRKAFTILERENTSLPDIEPKLNHGDFGPKHIMVQNGKISGILDFGEVQGNSPVHDLSRWDYWYGDEIPFEWLKAGYSDKSIFNENFENLYHLDRIHSGLGVLWYYQSNDYQEGINKVFRRLLSDLQYYS